MPELVPSAVHRYLETTLGVEVRDLSLAPIGGPPGASELKGFGYGVPVVATFSTAEGQRRVVIQTVKPGPFGHDHRSDRAQTVIWDRDAFERLPRHVPALGLGGFTHSAELVDLDDVDELFLLTPFVEGRPYFRDLERLRSGEPIAEQEVARADALCDYLVDIHAVRGGEPQLYVRRIRELLGHGECIFGLADGYPAGDAVFTPRRLERIEEACVTWRWSIKDRTHRLRQVHGDFHPWNILFREGCDFTVLDRSRGEWGDPADDVTCVTINYLFFALLATGRVDGDLGSLFHRFWSRYLKATGDDELLEVAAPFLVFRTLVLASPVWYPRLPETIRSKLAAFIENVLAHPSFDPDRVDEFLEL